MRCGRSGDSSWRALLKRSAHYTRLSWNEARLSLRRPRPRSPTKIRTQKRHIKERRDLLIVTHRRLGERGMMVSVASVASGWHAHLGILMYHPEGREPRPFWSWIVKMKAEYEKRIAR